MPADTDTQPIPWATLRHHRKAQGHSLATLSRASGVSLPYLSQLERGIRTGPSDPIVKRLADALGVTPAELTRP